MSLSDRQSRLSLAGGGLKQAIRFATYDWTREMPFSLRVITMIGMGIQGYAIWAALSRSLIWPIMRPSGLILYAAILLIYTDGLPDSIPGNSLRTVCTGRSTTIWPARCPASRRWWIPDSTRTMSRCCW